MKPSKTSLALQLAGVTLLLLGCAGPPASSTTAFLSSVDSIPRVGSARRPGHTWLSSEAKSGKRLLFVLQQFGVSSIGAGVYIFKQGGHNQVPIGFLEFGNGPSVSLSGLGIDASGTLYVGNQSSQTIVEYPRNSTTPSKVLTGVYTPWNVIVGKDGTVYVANVGGSDQGSVMEYQNGSTTPTLTITNFGPFTGEPFGMALDASNNLYVALNPNGNIQGRVFKFAPGSTQGTDLGLQIPTSRTLYGLALGQKGHLFIASPNEPGIFEFRLPSTALYRTIGSGTLTSPEALTTNKSASRLWASDLCCGGMWHVFGFSARKGTLADELSLPDPLGISGIASYPPPNQEGL
jgi:hypothetical protein